MKNFLVFAALATTASLAIPVITHNRIFWFSSISEIDQENILGAECNHSEALKVCTTGTAVCQGSCTTVNTPCQNGGLNQDLASSGSIFKCFSGDSNLNQHCEMTTPSDAQQCTVVKGCHCKQTLSGKKCKLVDLETATIEKAGAYQSRSCDSNP